MSVERFERKIHAPSVEPGISPEETQRLTQIYGAETIAVSDLATRAIALDTTEPPSHNEHEATSPQVQKAFENEITALESFRKQFQEIHKMPFGKDQIVYRKVIPEQGVNDTWVVFIGGFNSIAENYEDEVANLVSSGRKVLFINPETPKTKNYRSTETDTLTSLNPLLHTEVAAVRETLVHEGIERVDIVGHSRGGLLAAGYTAAYPGVDRLVLDCPAAIGGKEKPGALIGRALTERNQEKKLVVQDYSSKQRNIFVKQLAQNIWWKLNEEVPAIAKSDIRPLLTQIRSKSYDAVSSPEVILINAHSDAMFTASHIEKALGKDPYAYVDRWISYADKNAMHGKISHPDAGLVSQTIHSEKPENEIDAEQRIAQLLQAA